MAQAMNSLRFVVALFLLASMVTATEEVEVMPFDLRPVYHFYPLENFMNDPNGPMFIDGIFHLFYQYNPDSAANDNKHWGHAISSDLVHWEFLPIAIAPGPGQYDRDGIWSGSATLLPIEVARKLMGSVREAGHIDESEPPSEVMLPVLMYTGVQANDSTVLGFTQSQSFAVPACLASPDSCDARNATLGQWSKPEVNPFIRWPPTSIPLTEGFRDPTTAWKRYPQGAPNETQWVILIGGGLNYTTGTALVYTSTDFVAWSYFGLFATGGLPGENWECPDYFRLDSGVDVFKVSIDHDYYDVWSTGTYNPDTLSFSIERTGILDYGSVYAAKSFEAPPSATARGGGSRRVMWGWVPEKDSVSAQLKRGWAGIQALPRVITSNENGDLLFNPVEELMTLKSSRPLFDSSVIGHEQTRAPLCPSCCSANALLEVSLEALNDTTSSAFLDVLASPGGEEFTRIEVDFQASTVCVNSSEASATSPTNTTYQCAPLERASPMSMRLFVDHSVLELYVEGGASTITTRVYPSRADSTCVAVQTMGGAAAFTVQMSEMASIWEAEADPPPPPPPGMGMMPIPPPPQQQSVPHLSVPYVETPDEYSLEKGDVEQWIDDHVYAFITGVIMVIAVVIAMGGVCVYAIRIRYPDFQTIN